MSAKGPDLTSRAGTALLSGLADALGLTTALRLHSRTVRHEPGRIVRDLAVLLAWVRHLLLAGTELAACEPKRLRYRLLHVAGRIVRHARGVRLRLPRSWPWAPVLAAAFARLKVLPSGRAKGRPPGQTPGGHLQPGHGMPSSGPRMVPGSVAGVARPLPRPRRCFGGLRQGATEPEAALWTMLSVLVKDRG